MQNTPVSTERFYAVFCAYRASDVGRSLPFLRQMRQLLPGLGIVAVITGGEGVLEQAGAEADLFAARLTDDNSQFEFGAYQRGLDHLSHAGLLEGGSGVFFVNDSIGRKEYGADLSLTYAAYAASLHRPEAVLFGNRDRYRGISFDLAGARVGSWISTYLFYANGALLQALDRRIAYDLLASLDNRRQSEGAGALEARFFEGLDPVLAERLGAWLFRGGWYRSGTLLPETYLVFRGKLRSILNEMYLSALAERQGRLVHAGDYLAFLRRAAQLTRVYGD